MRNLNPVRIGFFHMVCPSYNIPMFKKIQNIPHIDFTLLVGDKPPPLAPKSGDYSKINHIQIKNYILSVFGITFVWQNFFNKFKPSKYDAVILSEGVFFISNYIIILICKIYKIKYGFYTHGFNHQRQSTKISSALESVRGFFQRNADFIIVYTNKGFDHVNKNNIVPKEKIFIAKNTLDMEGIWQRDKMYTNKDIFKCKESLQIDENDFLLTFVGRLEPEKNPLWVAESIEFLMKKGILCHALFIGDGSEKINIQNYKNSTSKDISKRIHLLGRLSVEDVDIYLKSSNISVMPGMTGLAVVHSFGLGKPYVTIESKKHSPEIEYLQHNQNGLITKANKIKFFEGIESLANNPKLLEKLSFGADKFARMELSSKKQIQAFDDLASNIQDRLI